MLKQLGTYKEKVLSVIRNSEKISSILIGDDPLNLESENLLERYTLPYLFSDGCISEVKSYIFVDVSFPKADASTKLCKITVQAVCHKDDYKFEKDGVSGIKPDILSEIIYQELIENKNISDSFGIGTLTLTRTHNLHTDKYFGHSLVFTVPDFR